MKKRDENERNRQYGQKADDGTLKKEKSVFVRKWKSETEKKRGNWSCERSVI